MFSFVVARLHALNELLQMSLHVDVNPGLRKWQAIRVVVWLPALLTTTAPKEIVTYAFAEQLKRQLCIQVGKYVVAILLSRQILEDGIVWQEMYLCMYTCI